MSFEELKMLCSFCEDTKIIEKLAKLSGSERFAFYADSVISSIISLNVNKPTKSRVVNDF